MPPRSHWRTPARLAVVASLLVGLMALANGVASAGATPGQASGAISAARCAANRAAGTITFDSPYGFDASAGIIDVYAAKSLGYFSDLCLNVATEATPPTAPPSYQLVSSGKATITGVGSAADVLTYVANGSNLTAIATYADTSDYALLTDPSTTSLRQLAGKTLGYKVSMPVVLTEMLDKAGVDVSKVNEVAVTTYDPAILPEGKVQALQVYQSNEPITLTAEHDAYREWTPGQFGVSGTFNVVVANTAFSRAHPGPLADFLRAELHGFDYCAANVQACVNIEAKLEGTGYPVAHSVAEWRLEAALATDHTLPGRGVGVETVAEWTPEANALRAHGIVKSLPSLSRVVDTSIAAGLYTGSRLLWPGK